DDGCACANLELTTALEVPAGVTVLVVGPDAPVLPSAPSIGLRLRSVADPGGILRAEYGGSPPATGTIAVLVKSTAVVVRAFHPVNSLDDFRSSLPQLT